LIIARNWRVIARLALGFGRTPRKLGTTAWLVRNSIYQQGWVPQVLILRSANSHLFDHAERETHLGNPIRAVEGSGTGTPSRRRGCAERSAGEAGRLRVGDVDRDRVAGAQTRSRAGQVHSASVGGGSHRNAAHRVDGGGQARSKARGCASLAPVGGGRAGGPIVGDGCRGGSRVVECGTVESRAVPPFREETAEGWALTFVGKVKISKNLGCAARPVSLFGTRKQMVECCGLPPFDGKNRRMGHRQWRER